MLALSLGGRLLAGAPTVEEALREALGSVADDMRKGGDVISGVPAVERGEIHPAPPR